MRIDERRGDKRTRGIDFLLRGGGELRFDRGETPAFNADVHQIAGIRKRRASNDQVHGIVLLPKCFDDCSGTESTIFRVLPTLAIRSTSASSVYRSQ
jgi:hypothetical protein